MDCNGQIRDSDASPQLRKLKLLIDRAAAYSLVVDVSFTADTVKAAQGDQAQERHHSVTTLAVPARTCDS